MSFATKQTYRVMLTTSDALLPALAAYNRNGSLGSDLQGAVVICNQMHMPHSGVLQNKTHVDNCKVVACIALQEMLLHNTRVLCAPKVPSTEYCPGAAFDFAKDRDVNLEYLHSELEIHAIQNIEKPVLHPWHANIKTKLLAATAKHTVHLNFELQVMSMSACWEHDPCQEAAWMLVQAHMLARRWKAEYSSISKDARIDVAVHVFQSCATCGAAAEFPPCVPADTLMKGLPRAGHTPLISKQFAVAARMAVFQNVDTETSTGFTKALVQHLYEISKCQHKTGAFVTDQDMATIQTHLPALPVLNSSTFAQMVTANKYRYGVLLPCSDTLFAAAFDPLPTMLGICAAPKTCRFQASLQSIATRMNVFSPDTSGNDDLLLATTFCVDVSDLADFFVCLQTLVSLVSKQLNMRNDFVAEQIFADTSLLAPSSPVMQAVAITDPHKILMLSS